MSELRTMHRASKTMAIVVLIVFFQVLAFAILGLGAISSDQEDARQRAIATARNKGIAALGTVRERTLTRFRELLREAVAVSSWQGLEGLHDHDHPQIAHELFRFDASRVVHWIDPGYLLYMPPEAIQRDWEAQRSRDAEAERIRRDAMESPVSAREALERWYRLATEFPLRLSPVESGGWYPIAAAHALRMLDDALVAARSAGASGSRAQLPLREAVLTALEIEAVNRSRPEITPLDALDSLDQIDERVDKLLRGAPPELVAGLASEVRGFQRFRDFLRDETRRRTIEAAVDRAEQAAGEHPHGTPFVFDVFNELVAVAANERGGHTVLRLDSEAVKEVIEGQLDRESYADLGLEFEVFGPREAVESEKRVGVRELTEGPLELPFRVAAYQVRDPVAESGGRSALFYWGIIALAGAGFLLGGLVLVRLMTREIRLARLKADFVSNLSHELKTPLTSIAIWTELFESGRLSDPKDQAEGYAVLAQESDRLQRIVARMIDVARKEAQGVPYDVTPGDLNEPIRRATARFRRIVTEPGLELEVALTDEPLPMMLDPAAMDDVVTNLLSNSWKYKRGDAAKITVRTERRGGHAHVLVSDDGVGIPRQERKRVFEMFYRADQYLTQPVSGTGLGLALVRTIVRAHKGKIRVGPGEDGRGTAFQMRFPLSRKAAWAAAGPSDSRQNEATAPASQGGRPAAPEAHGVHAGGEGSPDRASYESGRAETTQ